MLFGIVRVDILIGGMHQDSIPSFQKVAIGCNYAGEVLIVDGGLPFVDDVAFADGIPMSSATPKPIIPPYYHFGIGVGSDKLCLLRVLLELFFAINGSGWLFYSWTREGESDNYNEYHNSQEDFNPSLR